MSGYAVVSFKRTCLSIWCFIEICVFGWNVLCKIRRESTPSLSRLWTRVIYIFRLLCLLINREACLLRLLSVHPWRHGCLIKLTQSTWKLDFISCFEASLDFRTTLGRVMQNTSFSLEFRTQSSWSSFIMSVQCLCQLNHVLQNCTESTCKCCHALLPLSLFLDSST